MSNSPILILGYARTERILEMIKLVLQLGERDVYLSLDGPRNDSVAKAQEFLLNEIKLMNLKQNIKVRKNLDNQGVAVSVISGIDWFFSHEEFGIIIEDDLHFTRDFLSWCEWANSTYREDRDIFMISGNRFHGKGEITYAHYPQTWGWATWQDRWREIRPLYEGKSFRISKIYCYISNFWTGGTLRILSTVTDTWDILIAKHMKELGLLAVLPPVNLVSNLGADSFSTHTNSNSFPIGFPLESLIQKSLFTTPKENREIALNDRFLEERVFCIRPKHWFSLLKNLPLLAKRKELGRKLLENTFIEF